MQRLEVSGAVRPIYGSLGVRRLNTIRSVEGFLLITLTERQYYKPFKKTDFLSRLHFPQINFPSPTTLVKSQYQ